MVVIEEAFTYLSLVTSKTSQTSLARLGGPHVDAIVQILERWPASQRFPGTKHAIPSCIIILTTFSNGPWQIGRCILRRRLRTLWETRAIFCVFV